MPFFLVRRKILRLYFCWMRIISLIFPYILNGVRPVETQDFASLLFPSAHNNIMYSQKQTSLHLYALSMCIIIHSRPSSTPRERPTADGRGSRTQMRCLCAFRVFAWQPVIYVHTWDGQDFSFVPERLFGNAERAFWGDGRMCSGMRERCFGKPERDFPHNISGWRIGGTSPHALFIRF